MSVNLIGATQVVEQARQNTDLTTALLASATRTATTNTPDQINPYYRGCVLYLNITAASGTGGLKLNLQFKDPVSGNYVSMGNTPGSNITTTGCYVCNIYPTASLISDGGGQQCCALPYTWRMQITHADSSSYTYSLGCSMVI